MNSNTSVNDNTYVREYSIATVGVCLLLVYIATTTVLY